MKINDIEFNADLWDILTELQSQLRLNGINLLGDMKPSGHNIMLCCPYHNERRPSAGVDMRTGMFHCFSGETKVITYEYGAIEMKSIQELPVHILNGNGEWERVVFHNYGKQQLMKLTLSCNTKEKILYTTAEHRWILNNYHNDVCLTKDLKIGMYLQKSIPVKLPDNIELDPNGIIHGFCYGDGNNYGHNKDKTIWYHRCYFYNDIDFALQPYFEKIGAKFYEGFAGNGRQYRYALFKADKNYKEVPSVTETINYLLGFVAGYFVADGNCYKNKLTIYSHKYDDLYRIQQIFTRLGIMSTEIGVSNIKSGKRGCIVVKQDTHGYTLRLVRNTIPDSFFITDKGKNSYQRYNGRNSYKVISVEHTDRFEDVYCCQTSTHSFTLEHFILTGNCFACQEVRTLEELIAHCFGHGDDMKFGWNWLLKNFLTISVEERKDIPLDLDRKALYNVTTSYISEEELDTYRYTHPYMYQRGLTDEVIEIFDIGYDSNSDCITFPVRDVSGNTLFVARRSVKTKYFNYPKDAIKPLYGLYELSELAKIHHGHFEREVIICESMLDALSFWTVGKYAVALNGLGNELQFKQLRDLPCRELILCTDMDDKGLAAREKIRKKVTNKLITEYILPKGRKDANECTKDELRQLKKVF